MPVGRDARCGSGRDGGEGGGFGEGARGLGQIDVNAEVGRRVRYFRKRRGLTLSEVAERICKSQSAVSKYERGEMAIDVATLYDLAAVLGVNVELLLYQPDRPAPMPASSGIPAFFDGCSRFYAYVFDGRDGQIIRCVFEVFEETGSHEYRVMMYMNFADYASYQECETSYRGVIHHHDALTNILLVNRENPIEQASAQILASYLDADTKWGLFNGLSSRPLMPIATKMLFSKTRLPETPELADKLKISKNDLRMLKLYNMLVVV